MVATPIGNLEDITVRAVRVLLTTPVIACEDTRYTGNLIKLIRDRYSKYLTPIPSPNLGEGDGGGGVLPKKYLSVQDWNEAQMVEKVVRELQDNDVALVSDAGTPLISDPGFKVVRTARERGFTVSPIPGPTAAIAALSASGLPTNKFMFWGFLPKKNSTFGWDLLPEMTHIIYESPIRAKQTIDKIKDKYPQAQIVLAQELTKVHERVMNYEAGIRDYKGEVTLLVYLPAQTRPVPSKHESYLKV